MSQTLQILRTLKKGKSVTPLDALDRFGCFRLAARIRDLRRDGHDIETITETKRGKRFARYRMKRAA